MIEPFFKHAPRFKQGILCGAESSQEWLLAWWWSRYKEHNAYPVTFCDFGMTPYMRDWCEERGEVICIDMDPTLIAPKSCIQKNLIQEWESLYGSNLWHARYTWFKKPFAFLASAYEKGIWIDLDCEVLGNLEPLFEQVKSPFNLALVRDFASESLPQFHPQVRYNGGVIAFQHGAKIIEEWAKAALTLNHLFGGDDPLLSHLINTHQSLVYELPEIYNWRMVRGLNLSAIILHWIGNSGKTYIRKHGGLKPALDTFYQSCKGPLAP